MKNQAKQFEEFLLSFEGIVPGITSGEVPTQFANHMNDSLGSAFTSSKRKNNFIRGRCAASLALSKLNPPVSTHSLTPQTRASAYRLWPNGIVGSITHTDDLAVCVVSSSKKYLGLGVDIESLKRKTNSNIKKRICTKEELGLLESLKQEDELKATLTIFSAKESIYKALHPLVNKFFGFQAVSFFDLATNSLTGKLTQNLSCDFSKGLDIKVNYFTTEDYVLTLTVI